MIEGSASTECDSEIVIWGFHPDALAGGGEDQVQVQRRSLCASVLEARESACHVCVSRRECSAMVHGARVDAIGCGAVGRQRGKGGIIRPSEWLPQWGE